MIIREISQEKNTLYVRVRGYTLSLFTLYKNYYIQQRILTKYLFNLYENVSNQSNYEASISGKELIMQEKICLSRLLVWAVTSQDYDIYL